MIKAENLSKRYLIPHTKRTTLFDKARGFFKEKNVSEEFYALKNVSFEIKKGEVFGIIGKNGSGKTTLLKILCGIIPPTKGKIRAEKKITPFLDLGIGFHGDLTARENIYLYGAIMDIKRKKLNREFKKILEFAGVEKFADTKLKYFSSGMAVRLAFSTMMRTEFDVMVLDEVFAVGDKDFKKKCSEELMKFKKKGKTIILASHSMGEVLDFCDRAMLLKNGKMIMIGTPKDVVNVYTGEKEGK